MFCVKECGDGIVSALLYDRWFDHQSFQTGWSD